MPDAVMVAVANAVTDEIRGGDFGQEIQPERSYGDWNEQLENLGDKIRVDVVPVSAKAELATRSEWQYRVVVQIIVRKRLGFNQQDEETNRVLVEEVDELVLLTQRLGEYFAPAQPSQSGRRLTDLPEAAWVPDAGSNESGSNFEVFAEMSRLKEYRLYLGVVRLTFAVPRGPGD